MGTRDRDRTAERRLVSRIAAGETDALAEAYDAHAEHLFAVVYGITGSVSDAEDVVQDVFVALPQRLAGFRAESALGTWLHRVAVRAALLRLKRERLIQRIPSAIAWVTPVGEVHRPVDRVALERALQALPEEQRAVIWLKVVEGWGHEEIADLFGITPNASAQRLSRARRGLRAALGGR